MQSAIRNPQSPIAPIAPLIVGILNTTPDSFSDGGRYASPDAAVDAARRMVADGADWIDVGGESTRPGAVRVDAAEQVRRVVPIIGKLSAGADAIDSVISVDTTRVEVAKAAMDAGATAINDVSAGRDSDDAMMALAAERGATLVLMHMLGDPATMQSDPRYGDVVGEVADFLLTRAAVAEAAGVRSDRIVIDPGIGFGKTTGHNLTLLANLDVLVATGYRVMLGASRKRFLGELIGASGGEPADRASATAATTALGVAAGVRLFRVHDVAINRHAADVTFAALRHRNTGPNRADADLGPRSPGRYNAASP